jgi:uncharacterized protein YndB with AHSA1/START domain
VDDIMATVKETALLKATPDKVWSFVIEPEKLVQWRTDIKKLVLCQHWLKFLLTDPIVIEFMDT